MTTRFTIQSSDILKAARIIVVIHDDIESLHKVKGAKGAMALCQSWYSQKYDEENDCWFEIKENRAFNRLHFIKDALGAEIVSHEATHASLHLIRVLQLSNEAVVPNDCDKKGSTEEALAYSVGDITSKIYKQLYKRGIL